MGTEICRYSLYIMLYRDMWLVLLHFVSLYITWFSFSLEPQWFKEDTIWLDNELVRWASGETSSPQEQVRQTYPCKMCGKVFKTCSSLSKHKDVHRGATRCVVCNTVLSRASYLKQHLASVHGITPEQHQIAVSDSYDCSRPLNWTMFDYMFGLI